MKASRKAKTRLAERRAEYDEMIKNKPDLKPAYHRPGSFKK